MQIEIGDSDYDEIVRVIVVGDTGVGKSSLVLAYCDNLCPVQHIATIGVEYRTKVIKTRGRRVKLNIWDTAGLDRYRLITNSYYRGAQAVLLVFDITNPYSLCRINEWLDEIRTHMPESAPLMVVGNKCEKPEAVISEELQAEFMTKYNITIDPVSAWNNTGIDVVMAKLANCYLDTRTPKPKVVFEPIQLPKPKCRFCCLL